MKVLHGQGLTEHDTSPEWSICSKITTSTHWARTVATAIFTLYYNLNLSKLVITECNYSPLSSITPGLSRLCSGRVLVRN